MGDIKLNAGRRPPENLPASDEADAQLLCASDQAADLWRWAEVEVVEEVTIAICEAAATCVSSGSEPCVGG